MIVKYLYDDRTHERCVEIGDRVFYKDTYIATPALCRECHIDDLTAIKIGNYLRGVGPDLTIDGYPIPQKARRSRRGSKRG